MIHRTMSERSYHGATSHSSMEEDEQALTSVYLIQRVKEETHFCHMGYSFRLAASKGSFICTLPQKG